MFEDCIDREFVGFEMAFLSEHFFWIDLSELRDE
jgi:hypothetical protein